MDERTVLVIDDEPAIVDIIRRHLEGAGYKVYTAYDGEEGLKKAREFQPSLVILDIIMPKMDGIRFYSNIVVNNHEKMFPVLVLTERGEFKALFKDVEADGFISKPIDFKKLLAEVDRIFLKYKRMNYSVASRSVLIVEDNSVVLGAMLLAFAQDGFFVRSAKSVEEASQHLLSEPLNLVVAKLPLCEMVCGLREVPGLIAKDTVILLYASRGLDLDKGVIKKLCENAGVTLSELVRTDNPADLLRRAKEALGMNTKGR